MSKRSRRIFILLAVMLMVYFVYSKVNVGETNVLYGATDLRDKTFAGDLKVSGPTTFSDIKVGGMAKFEGPVTDSKNGTFSLLDIEGPAVMEAVKATKVSIHGPLTCTKCTLENINVLGPVVLDDSTVTDLTVTGPLSGDKLTVTNKSQVMGPVNVKYSTFNQLELNATESFFKDSTVAELIILADESDRKQVIVLEGNTTIEKDIVFKSGTGEVVVNGSDVKIKGIVGGVRKAKEN